MGAMRARGSWARCEREGHGRDASARVMGAMVTELAAAHELDPADPAARAVDGRAQRLADDRRTARRLARPAEPELSGQPLGPRPPELRGRRPPLPHPAPAR